MISFIQVQCNLSMVLLIGDTVIKKINIYNYIHLDFCELKKKKYIYIFSFVFGYGNV